MLKNCLLTSVCILFSITVFSQDEGLLVKKERIDRSKGIFIGLGPSFTLGKNIGDYSVGFNFEGGFLSRINRVLSVGPSVSYLKFNYDPEQTGINNIFLGQEQYSNPYYYRVGMYVDFKGGDLSLVSLSLNLKLNFLPIQDNSKISLYAFAKPFITSVTRTEVKGTAYIFSIIDYNDDGIYDDEEVAEGLSYAETVPWAAGDPDWADVGVDISDDLRKDNRVTGGIFLGPGIEVNPAKNVSFFLQASVGYTFPVSFVSTENYKGNDLNNLDERYPIIEEGFPSFSIQFGVSFNF